MNSAAEAVRKAFRGVEIGPGGGREGPIPRHRREGERVARAEEKAAAELLAHAAAGVGIRCRVVYAA